MVKNQRKKEPIKNNMSETNKKLKQKGARKWPAKMNVSLDEKLYERIKLLAEQEDRSMTKQLQYMIKQGIRFSVK